VVPWALGQMFRCEGCCLHEVETCELSLQRKVRFSQTNKPRKSGAVSTNQKEPRGHSWSRNCELPKHGWRMWDKGDETEDEARGAGVART
jgi:hypothetical protein